MSDEESVLRAESLIDAFSRDSKQVLIASFVAGGIALAGMLLVNVSSGSEGRLLLEAMMPSVRSSPLS